MQIYNFYLQRKYERLGGNSIMILKTLINALRGFYLKRVTNMSTL